MVVAGGTGGHVFPGLAVAEYLRSRGIDVVWMGTQTGLESRAVPAAGFEIEWIAIRSLRGRGFMGWLLLPIRLVAAMTQSLRIMRRRRPDVVLAMGGFVAGPGGLVACLLRKPLLIHEQNAVAGLTNRWLALFADQILAGFPNAFKHRPRARHVGNPVRREIAGLPAPQLDTIQEGRLCLLILGGSQGAQIFNEVVPKALRGLTKDDSPDVWHQCGERWLESTRAVYQGIPAKVDVTAFIDDMAGAYRWADLIICRAGAMTIAELTAAGCAAILVPLPHAADDHQTANARFLAEREAAILLPQQEFLASRVGDLLTRFNSNRQLLMKMAVNARRCAMPGAAQTVGQLCMEAMHA